MPTVNSADGTTIAFDVMGDGPTVILVDGASCYRERGPMRPLAEVLSSQCSVRLYDRRGRGSSGNTLPWAPQREIEDLQALLADGSAVLYAMSSGGALALATAAVTPAVTGLVLYEPPYVGEVGQGDRLARYTSDLHSALAFGDRDRAMELFLSVVGMPEPAIAAMRSDPGWPAATAIAHTLAYDDALLTGGRLPRDVAEAVTVPVLVVAGGASPQPMREGARLIADALPHGRFQVLDGETHAVSPDAIAPVVTDFVRSL